MKKYIYSLLISLLTMVIFQTVFSYLNFDSDFLVGWFACMGFYITLDYHERKNKFK